MKKPLIMFMVILLSLPFFSCGPKEMPSNVGEDSAQPDESGKPAPEGKYNKISPKEAKAMMDEKSSYIVLDVRTTEEFAEGHIDGAILIPDYEIESRAAEMLTDKEALMFVYCRSGRRSEGAARKLVSMGYTNVYDIGGITKWPYGTVRN